MNREKVALVTGANRGIGLEICRQLMEQGVEVFMTSRNIQAGQKIFYELNRIFPNVRYLPLDVTDESGIEEAVSFVKKTYGKLDILVNNAGISIDHEQGLNVSKQAIQETLETNFFGALRVSQLFLPLLRHSSRGRIINLSSGMGALSDMGTGYAAYRFSKTALNAVTVLLAAELADSDIKVFSMCPGWVRTNLGGQSAPRSVEEGAETAVWLALSQDPVSGKFYRDKAIIPW
jgi:NAD(P)-dependent dehydrogenase (short-subunit alcohol dehydrogenase family)